MALFRVEEREERSGRRMVTEGSEVWVWEPLTGVSVGVERSREGLRLDEKMGDEEVVFCTRFVVTAKEGC